MDIQANSKKDPYRRLVLETLGESNDNLLCLRPEDIEIIEKTLVEALTKREIQVIKMHCGIGEEKPLSCDKIGKRITNVNTGESVCRGRVTQILNKAYRKLRHPKYSKEFKWFFRGHLEYQARQTVKRVEDLEREIEGLEISIAEIRGASAKEIPHLTIDDLDLSIRTYNILKNARIYTLRDVVKWSESRIRGLRSCGEKSIAELKAKLSQYGLTFMPEE